MRGRLTYVMASLTADSPAVHTRQPSLQNKSVLISGGTTGIGRATAALLAAHGANVFIFGRHDPDLRSTLDELADTAGKVRGITADHSSPADVRRVFETVDREFGALDILI